MLLTGSVMVCEPSGPEVTVGITFVAGASSVPNNDQMLREEEE